MAAKGLNLKIIDEIHRLKVLGFGKRRIARTLGLHRNTVSKYFDPSVPESAVGRNLISDLTHRARYESAPSKGAICCRRWVLKDPQVNSVVQLPLAAPQTLDF